VSGYVCLDFRSGQPARVSYRSCACDKPTRCRWSICCGAMRVISKVVPAALVAAASVCVSACTMGGPGRGQSPAAITYSCCEAGDVNAVYHPGQTMYLHWIVDEPSEDGSPVTARGLPVELIAGLTGPYRSVQELKSNEAPSPGQGSRTFLAPTLRPARVPGERPVSAIAIPNDAGSGYYDLTFSVTEVGGGTFSGAGIIQITSSTT
jgi:hypothetical protein